MPPSAAATGRPRALVVNASVGLICLIWGSTWLVVKEGLEDLPPLTALAWRFACAALLFCLLTPLLRRREGGAPPPWRLVALQTALTFAYPYAALYWVETIIPSGLASVLWAVFPMCNAVAGELLLPGQRLAARHWLGFVLGFLGVVLLLSTDLAGIGPGAAAAGAFYLSAPLLSAVGNVLIKRHGAEVSSVLLNRNGLVAAAGVIALLALATERGREANWSARAVGSIAYLACLGTVVTFGLYFWLLRYSAAHKLALITYVIPAVALFLGWALGGEPVGWTTVAGAVLILAGVGRVLR